MTSYRSYRQTDLSLRSAFPAQAALPTKLLYKRIVCSPHQTYDLKNMLRWSDPLYSTCQNYAISCCYTPQFIRAAWCMYIYMPPVVRARSTIKRKSTCRTESKETTLQPNNYSAYCARLPKFRFRPLMRWCTTNKSGEWINFSSFALTALHSPTSNA